MGTDMNTILVYIKGVSGVKSIGQYWCMRILVIWELKSFIKTVRYPGNQASITG